MFGAQEGNAMPLKHPWMLAASRTLAWTDGCQGSPRGRADITSLQLSKCAPSSSKSEPQLRNRHPANVRQMEARTPERMGFFWFKAKVF